MNAPAEPLTFAPGVYLDLPARDYHKAEAMSSGGIKKMLQSPAHFRLMRDQPGEPTAAMIFGTAVHTGVLEPDTFDARVLTAPNVDRRTKEGKATWAAFQADIADRPDVVVLSADDRNRALRCVRAIQKHPAAAMLLDGGDRELSLFWEDAKYGVPCKARLDAWNRRILSDVKTTGDASPDAFARSIASYLYHAQAAHYISGAEHVLNESPDAFVFIAVESEPPHAVACYALPTNAILAGQHLANIALDRYQDALSSGEWRGYHDTIETIQLPKWATTFRV